MPYSYTAPMEPTLNTKLSNNGAQQLTTIASASDDSYRFPPELWLAVAEFSFVKDRISLSLCNQTLWTIINTHLKPLEVEELQQAQELDPREPPFCWFTMRQLQRHFPNHITCPECHRLHIVVITGSSGISYPLSRGAPPVVCTAFLRWWLGNSFVSALHIFGKEWFFWAEGRRVVEQMRVDNPRPLAALNDQFAATYWEEGPDMTRQAVTRNPFTIKWRSRAIFQVTNGHLLMREESHATVHSYEDNARNASLRRRVRRTTHSGHCYHNSTSFLRLGDIMTQLRRMLNCLSRSPEERLVQEVACSYCPIAYSFIVKRIASCPKAWERRCQDVAIVRWLDFGNFSHPSDNEWFALTSACRNKPRIQNLRKKDFAMFGHKLADTFDFACPTDILNGMGTAEQLWTTRGPCCQSDPDELTLTPRFFFRL